MWIVSYGTQSISIMNALRSLLLLSTLLLTGCIAPGYYLHMAAGQWQVMLSREPVDEVLADPEQPLQLKGALTRSQQMRQFAIAQLKLPDGDSYQHYATIDRPYVQWAVSATERFSLQPKRWCFPVVGCLAYRGFFSQQRAEAFAQSLREQGLDVALHPVPAYSSLGWWGDPLLSTTIHWPEADLARLIFHEMAHEKLYLPGDTDFNESYAEAVAQLGVAQWLSQGGKEEKLNRFAAQKKRRKAFRSLIFKLRDQLQILYTKPLKEAEMARQKLDLYVQFQHRYYQLRQSWQGGGHYDHWVFAKDLNNAKISMLSHYTRWVPSFKRLFAKSHGDWSTFHHAAETLSHESAPERQTALEQYLP
uniref:Aminopeptidase n=1 Tax=Magnetococcus massalia (strain MO-1) TaxID=451514 RepID=A0A1S7LQX7_MAGMO|nr:Protein of unknown function [Candidatus Magnetococcus massalia]